MQARVRKESPLPFVTAFAGVRIDRQNWIDVPASYLDEAARRAGDSSEPFLEFRESQKSQEAAIDATPAAVELAKEKGIPLSSVKGTGVDGRILKSDIEEAINE